MNDNTGQRLQALLQAKNGGNQSELARYVGVSPQAVQQWISGVTSPRGKNLERAAVFLNTTPGYIQFGGDHAHLKIRETQVPGYEIRAVDGDDGIDGDREVMVAVVDAELSAGNGSAIEFIETKYRLPYQIEWLRKVGVKSPDDVRLMNVRGDSMERTLFDGDKVLIHLKETRVKSDAVYAILFDGEAKVKRLFNSAAGIRIVSDNPDKARYPDELLPPEQGDRIVIIGRAIHRQGSSGL